MRIALLTEAFLPKFDGVVKSLCHLLDYLRITVMRVCCWHRREAHLNMRQHLLFR